MAATVVPQCVPCGTGQRTTVPSVLLERRRGLETRAHTTGWPASFLVHGMPGSIACGQERSKPRATASAQHDSAQFLLLIDSLPLSE